MDNYILSEKVLKMYAGNLVILPGKPVRKKWFSEKDWNQHLKDGVFVKVEKQEKQKQVEKSSFDKKDR